MSDSVGKNSHRVFVHALNTVKRIPRTGSARPPSSARLKLYGLYKQSMEGDVEGVMSRPPPGRGTEEEKWDAWSAQHGLSRTEAKRRYISTLIETMHQYASTTPEARELVAELEFVWDQIKSNSVSSASSPGRNQDLVSPLQSTQPVPASTEPAAANYAGGGGDGDSGALRMFRPVTSDTDQESKDGKKARYQMTRRDSPGSPPEGAGRRSKLTCEEYHQQNRKRMSTISQKLSNITREIATLREQLEARTTGGSSGLQASHGNHDPWNHPRRGRWGRLVDFIMATARHLIIDAVALGVLLWLWRSDERVRHVVTSMIQLVRKRIRRVEEVWRRRLV